MNQRFKFRVWNTASNNFLDLESGGWGYYFIGMDGKFMVHYNGGFGNITETKELDYMIVQQYLGIKDKKGKEMCEGDILSWGMGPMYEIVWDKTYARFHFPTITKQEGAYYLPAEEIRNSTICGNIFENPHFKETVF